MDGRFTDLRTPLYYPVWGQKGREALPTHMRVIFLFLLVSGLARNACGQNTSPDPLPSWAYSASRTAILDFVASVTHKGGPGFVAPADRIATFDNDGTLWSEQPMYVELAFTIDEVKKLAPQHPDWQTRQPFAAALRGDKKAMAASGTQGMMELFLATHSGMTTSQFSETVTEWIAHAQHPRFHVLYTQCVYQPMLELLTYLRANGFKTYIVSGGEQEFMRPWADQVYGIPAEQVIGTMFHMHFDDTSGTPKMNRMAKIDSIDDGPEKPVNIQRFIGKQPIAAFGNSDGDLQMLEWISANPRPHLALLVHHTDAEREYSYDRQSSMGRLNKGLIEAQNKHWLVVDMKTDWKTVFPPAKP